MNVRVGVREREREERFKRRENQTSKSEEN